tara:strand:- start:520 stop:1920 length:1401 start_codon:yes stop_codon:yes gene_type:complete
MTTESNVRTPIIDMLSKMVTDLEETTKHDPSTSKDLAKLKIAMEQYKKDIFTCNNDASCESIAMGKLFRQIPMIRDSIYPWKNYDWSYTNYVNNNYSAEATGSLGGSGSDMNKNINIFWKLFDAYFKDPNPGSGSVAGGENSLSDYPIYGCNDNKNVCRTRYNVKYGVKQEIPNNSTFLRSKSLTGEGSSSFFQQIGYCERPDISDRYKCDNLNFKWINSPRQNPRNLDEIPSGNCYQPKYIYLDNSPGLSTSPGDKPLPVGTKVKLKVSSPKFNGTTATITSNSINHPADSYLVECHDKVKRTYSSKNLLNKDNGLPISKDEPLSVNSKVILTGLPAVYGLNNTTGTVKKYNKDASDGNYRVLCHVDNSTQKVRPSSIERSGLKGLVPSMIGDTLAFTPDKMFKAFMGMDVPGEMDVQRCLSPTELMYKSSEAFTNMKPKQFYLVKFVTLLLIIVIIYCINILVK